MVRMTMVKGGKWRNVIFVVCGGWAEELDEGFGLFRNLVNSVSGVLPCM